MRKSVLLLLVIIVVVIALNFDSAKEKVGNKIIRSNSPTKTANPSSAAIEVFAKNLNIPWAIDFLPDGRALVTERPGGLKLIDKNGNVLDVGKLPIKAIGEGGLLGLAIDPNFSSNNFIYFYYTYSSNGNNVLNRVVRYSFDGGKLGSEKILVDTIPGASNHDGGRIKFGPDGFLYVTTGDAQNPSNAQNKNSLSGKILRITIAGKPAPGNPFDSAQGKPSGDSRVYSYGHRNPQGIAWDSQGQLWSTEHGRSDPTGYDELNLIQAGKNYGWDIIQGSETKSGMVTPVINSGSSTTWAPAGVIFLNGSIIFAGLRGEALYEYNIGEKKLTEHLKGQYGRIRDVILGPDGLIYITTSNRDGRGIPQQEDDNILRINPAKLQDL